MSEGLRERYGPCALVTGASDGIGRAFAQELARAGLGLVLVARRAAVLERLAAELRLAGAPEVSVLAADLATDAGLAAVRDALPAHDLGLMVAAAGFGTSGSFHESDLAAELAMFDVNCGAVLALTHALAPRLIARGRGGIVLMSSLVAFQGVPRAAHYAATKAYVQTLAEGLRPELRRFGVDVLAVAPGPVHSGFAARAGMTMGQAGTPEQVARGALRALGRRGTVRPGWLAKGLEASLAPLPRRLRTRILQQVMAGMTKGQDARGRAATSRPA